jgi:hypothetical protein
MRDGRRLQSPTAVRKVNLACTTLIESYCKGCGLLIAASPRTHILKIMESIHACPVYCCYAQSALRSANAPDQMLVVPSR